MLLSAVWMLNSSSARAQAASTCAVGTSACQQAVLWIDKGSGVATAKVLIPGNNTETNHNDSLECHGPGSGKCYLAFGANGRGILESVDSTSCNSTPTANVTEIGGAGNRFDAMALGNGTLYAIKGTQFGTINTGTGTFTATGTIGTTSGITVGDSNDLVLGMAWDGINFIASVDQGRGNGPSELVTINPASGHAVGGVAVQPDSGRSQVSGLVFVGSTLYAAASAGDTGGHLETLDPATGVLTAAGTGLFGTDIPKVRSLTADNSGRLYGLTGSAPHPRQPRHRPPRQHLHPRLRLRQP